MEESPNRISLPEPKVGQAGHAPAGGGLETGGEETGRETAAFKESTGEALISRRDYENTLNKILD